MTQSQIQALIEYIDAAIDDKLDDGNSSDEGLISATMKIEAKEKLIEQFYENNL